MRGSITLSTPEQRRLAILTDVDAGRLGPVQAAELLGISVRQLRRIRAEFRERGVEALVHGNRGRAPANTIACVGAPRVVELATTTYAGFNQHHFTEMLAEHEGLVLSRSTVRRILTDAGVPAPRRRRAPRHRQRRDRYPGEGMLLQVDGRRHDWLEGRGPYLSLVGAIDDATGLVPSACFREQEDAQGYFTVMRQVVQRHGIPHALYSDQHSIFMIGKATPTLEEQLSGQRRPTQFGRLLDELGVRLILARSPQAKGRVERLWGTFQDRLTSELRLAGAASQTDAEHVLARYLQRHNRRFTVPAADAEPAWMPWPATLRLAELFCFKYQRVVANDNTVRFGTHLLDIPPNRARNSYARARVEVHERFDGTLCVYYRGECLARLELTEPPSAYRTGNSGQAPAEPRYHAPPACRPTLGRQPPPPSHPWKRSYK